MSMFVRQLVDRLKESLWFLPAVAVAVAAIISVGLVQFDRLNPEVGTDFPLIFGGGPDGARGMLEAIASTVITAAATTFSVTIVALALSSSQFSPRVLRTFMADRANQVVLAAFMATFIYAILVLRTIRVANEDGSGEFVPYVAVTGAIVLAVVSLGMLIYFIHHIATRIQVAHIAASVASETLRAAERTYPDADASDGAPSLDDPVLESTPARLPARRSGYLTDVDTDAIVAAARDADGLVRLEARAGEWVQQHVILFSVWPAEAATDELAERLDDHLTIGDERSMSLDVGFGIQQLSDIGVKAISPGINDPTTAVTCLDRLAQVLVEVGRRRDAPAGHADEDGRLRLVAAVDEWPALVDLAFDQLRHFGTGTPVVTAHLVRTLSRIRNAVPSRRHPALLAQADLVAAAIDRIALAEDRLRVQRELDALRGNGATGG